MNLFIPHKVLLKRPDNLWFDLSCQEACSLKEQKYRSHKSNPTAATLIAYKAARTKAKCTVNRAKKRFFEEKTKSLAEDPNDSKSFWSIVEGLGTNFCSTSIPPSHSIRGHYNFLCSGQSQLPRQHVCFELHAR